MSDASTGWRNDTSQLSPPSSGGGWAAEARVLWRLVMARVRGKTHAERLESFYHGQAADYDSFRARLLHGRDELFARLPVPDGGVWVDLGAGTGENALRLGERLRRLKQGYLVDLCPSLLREAERRIRQHGWQHLESRLMDACEFSPPVPADLVTCSYSLTMIPDWFAVIENAWNMLKPGGVLAVVDFYVSRKHPETGFKRHGWLTRHLWPTWFAMDNVFLSADHLPYLHRRFTPRCCLEGKGRVPWMLGLSAPYYQFVGQKHS